MDKRFGVGHEIYHGDWNMILPFYVAKNPVAGHRGIDFTFRVMRYHPRFTAIEEDGQTGDVE